MSLISDDFSWVKDYKSCIFKFNCHVSWNNNLFIRVVLNIVLYSEVFIHWPAPPGTPFTQKTCTQSVLRLDESTLHTVTQICALSSFSLFIFHTPTHMHAPFPERTPKQLPHVALRDRWLHDQTPPWSLPGVLESVRQGRRIQVEEDRRDLPTHCRCFVAPPRWQIDSCFTAWESRFEIPIFLLSVEPQWNDSWGTVGDADRLIQRSDKKIRVISV